jgi:hypothetical protein
MRFFSYFIKIIQPVLTKKTREVVGYIPQIAITRVKAVYREEFTSKEGLK